MYIPKWKYDSCLLNNTYRPEVILVLKLGMKNMILLIHIYYLGITEQFFQSEIMFLLYVTDMWDITSQYWDN